MNWSDLLTLMDLKEKDPTVRGKVVGVSFVQGYPSNLYDLFSEKSSIPATLFHDSANEYDENACKVFVEDEFVGHLSRELAAEIAPKLDAEEPYSMVVSLLVNPDNPQYPGLTFMLVF